MIDLVTIRTIAGKGGEGAVSFLKLKNQKYGKPDGGDGGRGGSVFLESDKNMSDLENFRGHKVWKAEDGDKGGKMKRKGKNGSDLVLKVPAGTVVSFLNTRVLPEAGSTQFSAGSKTTPRKLLESVVRHPRGLQFDLTQPGQKILIAKGGEGGKGNSHAAKLRDKKGTRPRHWEHFSIGQKGNLGEEGEVSLELKYLAQIGIIGLPSTGKSTLLSLLTSASPKIADYPFTTLEPNLGVLKIDGERGEGKAGGRIVIADIPGIIEGAAKGKGLGLMFLRHIERTKLLLHLLNAGSEDPVGDVGVVREELRLYGHDLAEKKKVVVVNKIDLVTKDRLKKIAAELEGEKPVFISCRTGEGLETLRKTLIKLSKKL